MQFLANKEFSSLQVTQTRSLSSLEARLISANFLANLPSFIYEINKQNANFDIRVFVRSVLFQLPYLLRGSFHENRLRSWDGLVPNLTELQLGEVVGYFPKTGSAHDLHVPTTKTHLRELIQRNKLSFLAENLCRHPEVLFGRPESFKQFLGVYCNHIEGNRSRSDRLHLVVASVCLELAHMGELIMDLVVSGEFYHARLLSRIAVCVNKIYGESGALCVWRIAGADFKILLETPEDYLSDSILQTQLRL
ncbi:TPA_asm: P0 protein [Kalanchoe marnieriana polerovirus]|uniref:P0 protein n=1 Tax=Kalanchoe marnieriana polerovirus TaxID=2885086 RepID=A0AAD2KQ89_9VIRU|nr:TPA_asm: P0 protein [Kalanchoe marnieriana polerovirus]